MTEYRPKITLIEEYVNIPTKVGTRVQLPNGWKENIMTYITKREGKFYVVDGNGEQECKIDKYRDELIIPENESGRTRIKISIVEKSPDKCELKAPNKTWVDYLTDDEKATYEELRKVAEARMPKPKNLTPLEKAQRAKERAEAQIAKLLAELKAGE